MNGAQQHTFWEALGFHEGYNFVTIDDPPFSHPALSLNVHNDGFLSSDTVWFETKSDHLFTSIGSGTLKCFERCFDYCSGRTSQFVTEDLFSGSLFSFQ